MVAVDLDSAQARDSVATIGGLRACRLRVSEAPAMPNVTCPKCGSSLNVREDRLGRPGTCPRCKSEILLQSAPEEEDRDVPGPPAIAQVLQAIGVFSVFIGVLMVAVNFTTDGTKAMIGVWLIVGGLWPLAFAKALHYLRIIAERP